MASASSLSSTPSRLPLTTTATALPRTAKPSDLNNAILACGDGWHDILAVNENMFQSCGYAVNKETFGQLADLLRPKGWIII